MKPLYWRDGAYYLLDQTKLPQETVWVRCDTPQAVIDGIRDMIVRGAPAIGVSAAYGMALAARASVGAEDFLAELENWGVRLKDARPTAVNLAWAVDRMLQEARGLDMPPVAAAQHLLELAQAIEREDVEINRRLGAFGAALIEDGDCVLTHCNAGALATADYGTALGVIRAAAEGGKRIEVVADETRPYLQGARLTAYELVADGIPVTLICDNMAGSLMRQGLIQKVVVGADRIARNGDTANKVGTYMVAVLAKENGIPFYIAAPTSTIDLSLASGDEIPIEERDAAEVTDFRGVRVAAQGVKVRNPAFDVTPARYIAGIITEKGVFAPGDLENLEIS